MSKKYSIEEISLNERMKVAKSIVRHFSIEEKKKEEIPEDVKEILKVLLIKDEKSKRFYNKDEESKIIEKLNENKNLYPKEVSDLLEFFSAPCDPRFPEWSKYAVLFGAIALLVAPFYKDIENYAKETRIERKISEFTEERIIVARQLLEDNKELKEMENQICVRRPLEGVEGKDYELKSGFGWRKNPLGGGGFGKHKGTDWAYINKDSKRVVVAPLDATVTSKKRDNLGGGTIELTHENGFSVILRHMDLRTIAKDIKRGIKVKTGQYFGEYAREGIFLGYSATGPHLHYEIKNKDGKPVDPGKYLKGRQDPILWEMKKDQMEYAQWHDQHDREMLDAKLDSTVNEIKKSNLFSLLFRKETK